MTLEELIFLFIPKSYFFQGAKLSKVALPCSKLVKVKLQLLEGIEVVVCEVMLKLSVCCGGRGTPLFIHRAWQC